MLKMISLAACLLCPSLAFSDEVAFIRYFESNGVVTLETGGGASAQTPFVLASVGKTMTSVAVLRLVEAGAFSLDELARHWVDDDIRDGLGELEGVTLRHLLTMTSGLPDYLSDEYFEDALADPDHVQNPETALSYAFGEDALFRVARGFDYSNTNYVLLGHILENATGMTYAQAMERHVFKPAGMTRSFVFGSRPLPRGLPNGHEGGHHIRDYYEGDGFGDGGVIATAPDLARFYKALFAERSLLSGKMMGELLRDPRGEGYGMGIEIEDSIYGHSGGDLGFSTDVRMDVATGDIALIFVAEGDAATDWAMDTILKQ